MTNFFRSAGYGVEKLHSGMIAYMCELWNEGAKAPLASFLRHLGVPLERHEKLCAVREWEKIDLVVFAEDGSAVVAFEMKVDSHEGLVRGEPQTVVYRRLLPDETPFLYVTLGAGEFHRAPRDERTRWVRVRNFEEALEAVPTDDPFVVGWREAVRSEVNLQDACASDDPHRIEGYRGSTRNLYFLGYLKEGLTDHLAGRELGLDPFVHAVPPGPDTILHFGRSRPPAYLEINKNGLLNLKVDLNNLPTRTAKEERLAEVRSYYRDLLGRFEPLLKTRKVDQKSKTRTVMSFDVGLNTLDGGLLYASGKAETVRKSAGVLEAFYGSPAFDM